MTESRANMSSKGESCQGQQQMWQHCSREGRGNFEAAKEYLSLLSAPYDLVLRFSRGQSQYPCPAFLPAPEGS